MRKILEYSIDELQPYINWRFFFHAWSLNGKPEQQAPLKAEAQHLLTQWRNEVHPRAVFTLYEANSQGDDLVLYQSDGTVRFPMLRQQQAGEDGFCRSLADYIRPCGQGVRDKVGLFCTTTPDTVLDRYRHDPFLTMLSQVLSDRLAEAAAERLHEEVRRRLWGYAPDEQLTVEEMQQLRYQGIRPAIGFPSLPDNSANFLVDRLIGMQEVGIRLTESGMMTPHASVSGLMFAHPQARYFSIGKIGEDQLRDYARRRGVPVELMRRFLQSSLMK